MTRRLRYQRRTGSGLSPSPHGKVLLDASNLHSGGGVQVAASFLNELFTLGEDSPAWLPNADIVASGSVAMNLAAEPRSAVRTADSRPGAGFLVPARHDYDVAFTIFGPTYRRRAGRVEIVGFADPTVPATEWADTNLRALVKRAVKRSRIRAADYVVVESQAFARQTESIGVSADRIVVVPNACATAVRSDAGGPARNPAVEADLRFFYPARPYLHKNHRFLPEVREELMKTYGLDVRFIVTLSESELAALGMDVDAACIGVGVVAVNDLAALYEGADGVFFPSLLEVSSVTPLEALAVGAPLFASDRDFVRQSAEDAAVYFDPRDPSAAARAVFEGLADLDGTWSRVCRGLEIVDAMPSARDRALTYVKLIDAQLLENST